MAKHFIMAFRQYLLGNIVTRVVLVKKISLLPYELNIPTKP